uniref:PKS_ER domain-containing protein n=1 Tax=Heterorhabditis bacteriophora TaxID=37862 RepID=A0A1I7WTB5_HETBA
MTMRGALVQIFGRPENLGIFSKLPIPTINSDQKAYKIAKNQNCDLEHVMHRFKVKPNIFYYRLPFSVFIVFYISIPHTSSDLSSTQLAPNVGSLVTHVKKGDRVWFVNSLSGSSAEYCVVQKVFLLPKGISYYEGACIGVPYMSAYRAMFLLGKAKKGDTVFVHGASGGVGLAAVQLASWRGITVFGTAGSEEGMKLVKANGAVEVFNHRRDGYIDEIKRKCSQGIVLGFDLIVEMAAHINLGTDLGLLSRGGKVAVVGNREETTIDARLLMMKESSIFGMALANSSDADLSEMGEEINSFLSSSSRRPVFNKKYALEELPIAHDDIINQSGALGNLVLVVNNQI